MRQFPFFFKKPLLDSWQLWTLGLLCDVALFAIRSGEELVIQKAKRNREQRKRELFVRLFLSPAVLGFLSVKVAGGLEDAKTRVKRQVYKAVPKNPVRLVRVTRQALTILRWVKWGQPLIGLSNKFKGAVSEYIATKRLE